MKGQIFKLLMLLNGCFWLTIVFTRWKGLSQLPQAAVSTVVVLGTVAIVGNLYFWLKVFRNRQMPKAAAAIWVRAFILISTLAQLFVLFTSSFS